MSARRSPTRQATAAVIVFSRRASAISTALALAVPVIALLIVFAFLAARG